MTKSVLRKVPNYEQNAFVDTPAVDVVTGSYNDWKLNMPDKVSTGATQRIGMRAGVKVDNSTYLKLVNADGAKLGFGERVGAVTVFSTNGVTGSATQQIDSRRQGVSVRTLKQFNYLLAPLIRLTNDPLIKSGIKDQDTFIDHRESQANFGQPKLFKDPINNSEENAFEDLEGIWNPVMFLKSDALYFCYPQVYDINHYLQPDQLDGVIEVFDIRRTFSNTSIVDLPFMKGIKCELAGASLNNLKGTAQIESKYEIMQPLKVDWFEDSQDVLFSDVTFQNHPSSSLGGGKFGIPGIVSTAQFVLPPFNESVDYLTGSYDQFAAAVGETIGAMSNTTTYNLNAPFQSSGSNVQYSQEAAANLTAWWRINSDLSSVPGIYDSSKNANTMAPPTPANQPSYSSNITPSTVLGEGSSMLQGATTTGGSATFIRGLDSADLTFGNGTKDEPFAISCWFKLNGGGNNNILFSKVLLPLAFEYMLTNDFNGHLQFSLYDNSTLATVTAISSIKFLPGVWHHIVVTYNGQGGAAAAQGIRMFHNGSFIEKTFNVDPTYTAMEDTIAQPAIGNTANAGWAVFQTTNVNIIEVAVWKNTLDGEDIKALYDAGLKNIRKIYPSMNDLFYGKGIKGPYSKMSAIGTRFKSATCGIEYGESNKLGTDSIAFGGYLK